MVDSVPDIAVEVVRDRTSLLRLLPQWEELARHALEPNPIYLPWMVLSALLVQDSRDFHCCLLWARDPERSDLPAELAGLFPFERQRHYSGFPASTLRSWSHPSWKLCTPLVRAEGAPRYLAAMLDWLERDGAAVVEFRHVPRDGRFSGVLADVLRERKSTVYAYGVELHNVVIGSGALGEMWVSMLPLMQWRKRGLAPGSRRNQTAATAWPTA